MSLLTPNFDAIPDFLLQEKYWCIWPAEPKQNGGISKRPLGSGGYPIGVDNLKKWISYDNAKAFYEANKGKTLHSLKGPIAGIGVLFHDASFLVGIDLDHILAADGTIAEWAQPFIEDLKKITYLEISPSGTGLHAYLYGEKPKKKCKGGPDNNLEVYEAGRHFTVTGRPLDGCQNEACAGPEAQALLDKIIGYISQYKKPISTGEREAQSRTPDRPQGQPETLTDSELIAKARQARNGRKFSALFDGDISDYPSPSEADLALANKFAFWTGKDPVRMDALMRQSALLQEQERINKWEKVHSQGATYGEMTIAKAIQDCHTVYEPRGKTKKSISTREKEIKALPQKPGKCAGKVKIEYALGQMPRMRRELEQAMQNTTYQLGEALARVINVPRKEPSEDEVTYTTKIDPLSVDSALGEAEEVSSWYKFKEDKKTGTLIETPINAPLDVVKQLLAWKKWKLPLISGVVNCPIMRANGGIIDKPGYDKQTCLYAYFNQAEFPRVNQKSTEKEIKDAHELLKNVLIEFPFKEEVNENNPELPAKQVSRAVAISMLLTPLIQQCLDNIPFFAITSPVPGTGKSYLADLVSIILCGARADFITFIPDEVEFEKLIFAKLLAGAQCCLIDNIDRPLNSQKLNSVLTQERMSGRILGLSKDASVSTKCLFVGTGNNLEIGSDLTRRTLLCVLDANTERPAERTFKNANLHKWALKHRGQLVHAGLTILRGHCVAGFPGTKDLTPFGSFNEWSKWVRGAVIWLGEDDPCASQDAIREGDSERQQFLDVLNAWHEAYRNSSNPWRTAKDILEPPINPELKAALENAVSYRRDLTTRALGSWLKKNKGRIIDRKQLIGRMDTHTKIIQWQVKDLG